MDGQYEWALIQMPYTFAMHIGVVLLQSFISVTVAYKPYSQCKAKASCLFLTVFVRVKENLKLKTFQKAWKTWSVGSFGDFSDPNKVVIVKSFGKQIFGTFSLSKVILRF